MQPSIPVDGESSIIGRAVFKTLIVVAYPPGKGRRNEVFLIHITAQDIDHLHKNNTGFVIFVRTRKYLTVGKRMIVCLVMLATPKSLKEYLGNIQEVLNDKNRTFEVLEWRDNVLYVIEALFLFYLRWGAQ